MRVISEDNKSEMLFRKDNDNGIPSYSIGLSKKKMDSDEYERGYQPVRFKKGTDIPNQTKIVIKNAFPTFDKWTDSEGKTRNSYYIMILDYTLVEEQAKQEQPVKQESDPFQDFSNEVELSDDDLPF